MKLRIINNEILQPPIWNQGAKNWAAIVTPKQDKWGLNYNWLEIAKDRFGYHVGKLKVHDPVVFASDTANRKQRIHFVVLSKDQDHITLEKFDTAGQAIAASKLYSAPLENPVQIKLSDLVRLGISAYNKHVDRGNRMELAITEACAVVGNQTLSKETMR